ncbi:MAG: hypothetical protein QXL69_00860 [Candidatus Bathyarchaeia archaeon]|nr:hypothetical protein [Candidatus Bathyarchaeota archaeon]
MKVFFAPGLFKNIKRSIADGVSVNELDVRDPLLKEKILKFYGASPIKLWALKESLRSRWASIDEGDYVLFYHAGKFIYAGKVSFKYPFVESPKQVEAGDHLAESVWGKGVDGKTWPYLFFLKDVREIDVPLSKLNKLTGYNLKAVRKFMKIQEEKAKNVKPPITPPPKPVELLQRDEIVDTIYALGELIGYKPEKKWRHERSPKEQVEKNIRKNLEYSDTSYIIASGEVAKRKLIQAALKTIFRLKKEKSNEKPSVKIASIEEFKRNHWKKWLELKMD